MSQIRLYLDEDIHKQALILALRNYGIDVLTTSEANKLSSDDEEQLIWQLSKGASFTVLGRFLPFAQNFC